MNRFATAAAFLVSFAACDGAKEDPEAPPDDSVETTSTSAGDTRLHKTIADLDARLSALEDASATTECACECSDECSKELIDGIAELLEALSDAQKAIRIDMATIANKTERIDSIEDSITSFTDYIRVEGTDIIVEGANLHVRSGAGRTDADPNGVGNVVVGYNESLYLCQGGYNDGDVCVQTATDCDGGICSRVAPPITTGSHNLIIGPRHDYSSHSCLLAGDGGDGTEGPYCAVLPVH